MSENDDFSDLLPSLSPDELRLMGEELRAISSRGDDLAIASGEYFILWGLVLAGGAFYNAFEYFGYLPPFPVALPQAIIGWGGTFIISRVRRNRLFMTWKTQVISGTWMFAGISILVYVIGCGMTGQSNSMMQTAFLAVVYGMVMSVTATASHYRWLWYPASGWLLTALATFFMPSEATRMLLYGIVATICTVVPGIILAREERKLT